VDLGLSSRACVVTGASGGIGREVAVVLAREGASLLLVGRRDDALRVTIRRAHEAGGGTRARRRGAGAEGAGHDSVADGPTLAYCVLDVTAPDVGEQVLQVCQSAFGRADVLVNCAGTTGVRSPEELTDAEWQAQWDLHVMAPMRLTRALAPAMAERGWGRIVNVASSAGKRPSGMSMAYSVTKAAQLSLSRAFADRYAARGVLVNAVAPGPIAGDLWLADGGIADQTAAAQGITREQVLASTAGRVPRGRFGTPQEVAAVIAFLCSEQAANVAGAAWSVDGGAVPVII
jgi:NAD(P)-dependent dehydrogenase (short-subunit alcohol dehydrogenase family)